MIPTQMPTRCRDGLAQPGVIQNPDNNPDKMSGFRLASFFRSHGTGGSHRNSYPDIYPDIVSGCALDLLIV
jgi:hypothetical protein